jgi:hypothetical protein
VIGSCVYCLKENVDVHKDHLIPRVRGGSDEIENYVTACEKIEIWMIFVSGFHPILDGQELFFFVNPRSESYMHSKRQKSVTPP